MIEIPLATYPDQKLQIDLDGQMCTLHVFERSGFMYLDLTLGRALLAQGMLCQPTTPILPPVLKGFSGNLCVIDTAAASESSQESPEFPGWGTRWKLYWLSPDDITEMAEAS